MDEKETKIVAVAYEQDLGPAAQTEDGRVNDRKVLRKMDWHLLPILSLFYLLASFDRSNIGNAAIEGLIKDLHMTGPEFNWALTIFFFSYSVFGLPSNVLLKRLRPSIWLPSIMVLWGTVMTLMGIVQGYHGLLAARFFLGVCEAGLLPGAVYYISMWYRREELQYRLALSISSVTVAGAFSGLFAFAIAKMDGVGHLAGWRWIFILEGLLTIVVAVAGYFLIYDSPETAAFLSDQERAWIIHRQKYQGSQALGRTVAENEQFDWKVLRYVLLDFQIYLQLIVSLGIVIPSIAITLFLPTVIRELGYAASIAQLLTVPVYVISAVLAVGTAWLSDRKCTTYGRAPFLFIPMCLTPIGFLMAICGSAKGIPGVVYSGVYLSVSGAYISIPGALGWLSSNLAGSYKRGAGLALNIGISNLGGVIASNIYRANDSPRFILGHALSMGFSVIGLVGVIVLRVTYARINEKRSHEEVGHLTEAELSKMGDKAPTFRYSL